MVISIIGCLLTSGCNDTNKQRALAVAGATEFQAKYNNQDFAEIYDQAADYVHRQASRRWWIGRCSFVRAELGVLRDFQPTTNNAYPIGEVGTVWISGSAIFDSGPATLRLDWDVSNGSPKLSNVQIERAAPAPTISIPGFTGEVFR
jgi:hypothetical protein